VWKADFTIQFLKTLLTALRDSGYTCNNVTEFASSVPADSERRVILRHDIDRKLSNALTVARLESELGIRGTYYFRVIPSIPDRAVINAITSLGHEAGYHYEDVQIAWQRIRPEGKRKVAYNEKDLAAEAYRSFRNNLARLREIVPIETISMHGSPLSRHDGRLIWKYHDYTDLGIKAEPYFDFSLDEMLYLTDTGRRLNGDTVSVRDRRYDRAMDYYSAWIRKPVAGSAMAMSGQGMSLHNSYLLKHTDDIVKAASSGNLPRLLLITIHPQRWSDSFNEWMSELISQKMKNLLKYCISKRLYAREHYHRFGKY